MKAFARIALISAILYAAGCIVVGIALADLSTRLHKSPLHDVDAHRARLRQRFHIDYQDAAITASDGAVLKAWYAAPVQANGQSVIILHGITATRIDSTGFAEMFLARGYSVLLPDSRDHGESGGERATYGILERDDVQRWTQWLRTRTPGCTYLLGESMGAAIGLQAASVTPQLCAVVVESPYFDFREVSYERMGRGTHTGTLFWKTLGRPVLETAFLYARLRYHFDLPTADNRKAVEQSRVPTLLIGDADDISIPAHHAKQLQSVCASHCTLWIVPGAGHGGASTVAHAEFEQRITDWFAQHVEPHAAPSR